MILSLEQGPGRAGWMPCFEIPEMLVEAKDEGEFGEF